MKRIATLMTEWAGSASAVFSTVALLATSLAVSLGAPLATPAHAQADTSPTLLLESAPTTAPGYRRSVHVHYLDGPRARVSYRALNRTEFAQAPGSLDAQAAAACARGEATTLDEIDAFQRAEARRARRGEAPETVRFCIKGVRGWEAGAQKRWLDPIFEGMPFTAPGL